MRHHTISSGQFVAGLGQMVTDKNHPDYQAGVRMYTVTVGRCRTCNCPTNTLRINPNRTDERLVLACSEKCAERC